MAAPKGKYAWTATVGEKGQIVIPKQAREIFGIKPGDTLLLRFHCLIPQESAQSPSQSGFTLCHRNHLPVLYFCCFT